MKKIGFHNFRSLKDIDGIDIKPITVVVGKNSSGKSTFLRSFPLMRQTAEVHTKSPLLWYDPNFVDFGSYDECQNIESKQADDVEKNIALKFNFDIKTLRRGYHRYYPTSFWRRGIRAKSFGLNVDLCVSIAENNGKEYFNYIEVKFEESVIRLVGDKDKRIKEIIINNEDNTPKQEFNFYLLDGIIPTIIEDGEYSRMGNKLLDSDFYNFVYNNFLTRKAKDHTIDEILNKIELCGYKKFCSSVKKISKPTTWNKKINTFCDESYELHKLHNYFLLANIQTILEECNFVLSTFYKNSKYVAPVRANAERYYRKQGLAIESIDARGINLPMYLENLKHSELTDFKKWTKENFGFLPDVSTKGGHISISIELDGEKVNLADTGFGYSQILPIITQLWSITKMRKSRIFDNRVSYIIEQPELHLHPAFQALLVDVFVKSIDIAQKNEISLNIIFETHSETMINRLGQHVALKNMSNDKISLAIFNSTGFETTITKGEFDEKGILKDWPFGFFYPDKIKPNVI